MRKARAGQPKRRPDAERGVRAETRPPTRPLRKAGPGGRRPELPESAVESPGSRPQSMRIAKAIARAGLCSRRDAERWIAEGRVAVNGEVLKSPARDVAPEDTVIVDGKVVYEAQPAR